MNGSREKRPSLGLVVGLCLVSIVVCGLGLVLHINRAGNQALECSDRAFDVGDLDKATSCAREAATWYLPQAPHVQAAYARLRSIALGSEAMGDVRSALRAWGALRSALIETAHPWDDRAAAMNEASQGVVRLLLLQKGNTDTRYGAAPGEDAELSKSYALDARETGRSWFGLLTSAGMLLMLTCGCLLLSGANLSLLTASLSRVGFVVGLVAWTFAALGQ